MKKTMIAICSLLILAACDDRLHGSGAVETRLGAGDDSNSYMLPSARNQPIDRSIDSSNPNGKYREDLQERNPGAKDSTVKDTMRR